jgi:nucleoside-diphosphate-sugar epimerase
MPEQPTKPILVTGAAGGVGRSVCQALAAAGRPVKALILPSDPAGDVPLPPACITRGSIEDAALISGLLAGAAAVVNCAALLPASAQLGWDPFRRINVAAPVAILKAAAANGVRHAVFFSTISVIDHVENNPGPADLFRFVEPGVDVYLRSKIELETALHGLAPDFPGTVTVIRPAFIYGRGSYGVWKDGLELLRQGTMRLIDGGKGGLPLVGADDLAALVRDLIESPPAAGQYKVVIAANPEKTTFRDVFFFLAETLGVPAPRSISSRLLAPAAALLERIPPRLLPGRLRLLTRNRVRMCAHGYDLSGMLEAQALPMRHADWRAGLRGMLESRAAHGGKAPP